MSTPTSTLGRQNSRTELNAESEERSTEGSSADTSSKESSSGTGNSKGKQQPAVQQRPRPRAGTWVAATVSGSPPSTSNVAPSTQKNSTEPALSPRGGLPPLPTTPGSSKP
ncbi:MAG: hypothetical protein RL083_685, partial [Pseudomonadota bacterium]